MSEMKSTTNFDGPPLKFQTKMSFFLLGSWRQMLRLFHVNFTVDARRLVQLRILLTVSKICYIAICILHIRNKLTEISPNLSGNSSIAIDMAEVSEAAPPSAESALNRKLNTMNTVLLEIQAQKLKARKRKCDL